jgi:hypothetical protein
MKNKKTYPEATRLQFVSNFYKKTTIPVKDILVQVNKEKLTNSPLMLDSVFHDLKTREQKDRHPLQIEKLLQNIASTVKITSNLQFQIDSYSGQIYDTTISSGSGCLSLKRNFTTTVQEVRSILITKELLKMKELHIVDDLSFEEAVYVLNTFCCDDRIFKMDYPILIFYKIPKVLYPGCLWAFRNIKNAAGIFDLPWHVHYEIPIPLVITKENVIKLVDE